MVFQKKLDKFDKVIWAENPANNDFQWTIGGDVNQ